MLVVESLAFSDHDCWTTTARNSAVAMIQSASRRSLSFTPLPRFRRMPGPSRGDPGPLELAGYPT